MLLTAKRWTKTHLQYPSAANVITWCRYAYNPDNSDVLGKRLPTCKMCLEMWEFDQKLIAYRKANGTK